MSTHLAFWPLKFDWLPLRMIFLFFIRKPHYLLRQFDI